MTVPPSLRPIVTNPGGVVDPGDLVGREREVARLVRSTATGGAKLLGERRIGKTSILRAVEAALIADGATVVRVSAETNDPQVFGADLLAALRRPNRLRDALGSWGGSAELKVGVGSTGLTLKASREGAAAAPVDLFRLCADRVEASDSHRLVFLFDEITTLARALESDEPGAAASFFRSLRRPRQEISGVSVILAGSVGLHHVLVDMSPVNDLDGVPIGPLQHPAAVYLARCLLQGANQADDPTLATDIATQAAGVPFYIHKIVQEIAEGWSVNGTDDLDALVEHALQTNQWGTDHDLTRLEENFGPDADLALALLDIFASETSPLSLEAVSARLAVSQPDARASRTDLLAVIARLEEDHYLNRVGNDSVFSHELQRRIWRSVRRLG